MLISDFEKHAAIVGGDYLQSSEPSERYANTKGVRVYLDCRVLQEKAGNKNKLRIKNRQTTNGNATNGV